MAQTAEQKRANRAEKRARLLDELGGKCYDCGESRWYVLDLHHRDPLTRNFGLSGYRLDRKLEALREEAKKCDLVCATCHRVRHYEEIQHNGRT